MAVPLLHLIQHRLYKEAQTFRLDAPTNSAFCDASVCRFRDEICNVHAGVKGAMALSQAVIAGGAVAGMQASAVILALQQDD